MMSPIPKNNFSLSFCFLILAGWFSTSLISSESLAAEQEIALNRQWAEQIFSADPGTAPVASNRLIIVHEDVPGDTKIGYCTAGGPIRLGDKIYEKGIGVNSHSVVQVSLLEPAERFVAMIGLDRNMDNTVASVRFHVQVAGKDVFLSEVTRPGDGIRSIDVPLQGAKSFELIVDDGGDGRNSDQADWANARVILTDGTELWLDALANTVQLGTDLPFSFVYGGRHSSEFIETWQRTVKDITLDDTQCRRILILTDPQTGLEVKAVVTIYTDTAGVDWTLYFTNTSKEDTPIIEQVQALDVSISFGLGSGKTPVLHRIHGSRNGIDDWHPFPESIPIGKRIEFGANGALSSYETAPFFNIDWASGGVITAIGWTGNWGSSVSYHENKELHCNTGMRNIHLKLHPGETIRTPRIMQLYWLGSDELRSYNLFRRTMLNHIVPKINGETIVPPIVHMGTAFYELNSSSEENVLSHLDSIKGLGFEYFWMDAYWMRGDVDHEAGPSFPNGIGNYGFPIERVPGSGFPRGLKPIGDKVHKEKMGFVVWFGPEIVYPNTYLAREHPEWVISPANNGSGTFNLGIPEAREYMTRYMNTVIKEYGIDCWRTDSGPQLAHWEFNDAQIGPDRAGITEIRHVEGYYQMWDDMRKANPHLFIDDCCGGGQRIDLETMSRAIPLWRTDGTIAPLFANDFNQAAMLNQIMTAGLNRYVPFSTSGMMGATPYWFRSGVNGGGISFCEDVRPLDYNRDAARKGMKEYNSAPQDRTEEYPRDLLKKGIAEAKRTRKYYFGNYYPLTEVSTSTKDWCVTQYHRSDENDGMIVAFRRHESPWSGFDCQPYGIDADAKYEVVQYYGYDPEPKQTRMGRDLQQWNVVINSRPGSVIVEYRKIDSE